jgi:tetrahydromethanopterin S-methyltransferase subunit B
LKEWDSGTSGLSLVPIKDPIGKIVTIIDDMVNSSDPVI